MEDRGRMLGMVTYYVSYNRVIDLSSLRHVLLNQVLE